MPSVEKMMRSVVALAAPGFTQPFKPSLETQTGPSLAAKAVNYSIWLFTGLKYRETMHL